MKEWLKKIFKFKSKRSMSNKVASKQIEYGPVVVNQFHKFPDPWKPGLEAIAKSRKLSIEYRRALAKGTTPDWNSILLRQKTTGKPATPQDIIASCLRNV